MRILGSVFFLVVHVVGALLALRTLLHVWESNVLLGLVFSRILGIFFGGLSGVMSNILVGCVLVSMVLIIGLAVREAAGLLRRLLSNEAERDVALRLRALLYFSVGCILFNVLVLSVPESMKGPFRVRFPVLSEITASLTYGCYALWYPWLPRLERMFADRPRRILDIVCMNVVVTLVLTEFGLRFLATVWATPILVTESSSSQIRRESERMKPGAMRFGFPINKDGHYDIDLEPGNHRPLVASIGDSFAYGMVPHPYHFTTVCERELPGVEVYNMGFPGTGPPDYIYLVEQAAALAPDLIVIQLFVGNDIAAAAGPKLKLSARWFDADRYLSMVVLHRLRLLMQYRLSKSTSTTKTTDQWTSDYPWLEDPMLEEPTLNRELYVTLASGNAWTCCSPIDVIYERFFRSLRELEQAAGDIPVAFVLIPDEFQLDDELWNEVQKSTDDPLERFLAQSRVNAWMDNTDRPFLDLLPALQQVEPMEDGKRHLYHLNDMHFNRRGNEFAGRELARFLKPILALPAEQRKNLARGNRVEQSETGSAEDQIFTKLFFGQPESRKSMIKGWGPDESDDEAPCVWSEGANSILSVSVPVGDDIMIEFDCQPFVFPGSPEQSIEVYFNGTSVGNVRLRPGRHKYSVSVSKFRLAETGNLIVLRYAHYDRPVDVLPDSRDTGSRAVCWYSLSISRPDR